MDSLYLSQLIDYNISSLCRIICYLSWRLKKFKKNVSGSKPQIVFYNKLKRFYILLEKRAWQLFLNYMINAYQSYFFLL